MGDHIGEGENQYVLSVLMTMNTLHTKHTHTNSNYVLSHSLCQTKQNLLSGLEKNSNISEFTFPSSPGCPPSLTLCC